MMDSKLLTTLIFFILFQLVFPGPLDRCLSRKCLTELKNNNLPNRLDKACRAAPQLGRCYCCGGRKKYVEYGYVCLRFCLREEDGSEPCSLKEGLALEEDDIDVGTPYPVVPTLRNVTDIVCKTANETKAKEDIFQAPIPNPTKKPRINFDQSSTSVISNATNSDLDNFGETSTLPAPLKYENSKRKDFLGQTSSIRSTTITTTTTSSTTTTSLTPEFSITDPANEIAKAMNNSLNIRNDTPLKKDEIRDPNEDLKYNPYEDQDENIPRNGPFEPSKSTTKTFTSTPRSTGGRFPNGRPEVNKAF